MLIRRVACRIGRPFEAELGPMLNMFVCAGCGAAENWNAFVGTGDALNPVGALNENGAATAGVFDG